MTRLRAVAEDVVGISALGAKQPLAHLAPRGISRAQHQHPLLHAAAPVFGNQCRVRLQNEQTDNITGTSIRTPTTVASAAPEPGPNSAIAVATASSKKLLAPISAPGAATAWSTPNTRMS